MASTIVEGICARLADDIIGGRLRPGQKLEELALARRFKVSRTPIREALRELAARGLIALAPRKGGTVASIGVEQLADMLEAECELEALCAKISAHRMSPLQKKQLESLHQQADELVARDDTDAYLALNREFHDLIIAGTQNRSLGAMVENFRIRLAPFRSAQGSLERRLPKSFDEHAAVVAAISGAKPDAAYAAMRDHNARLSSRIVARLGQAQALSPAKVKSATARRRAR